MNILLLKLVRQYVCLCVCLSVCSSVCMPTGTSVFHGHIFCLVFPCNRSTGPITQSIYSWEKNNSLTHLWYIFIFRLSRRHKMKGITHQENRGTSIHKTWNHCNWRNVKNCAPWKKTCQSHNYCNHRIKYLIVKYIKTCNVLTTIKCIITIPNIRSTSCCANVICIKDNTIFHTKNIASDVTKLIDNVCKYACTMLNFQLNCGKINLTLTPDVAPFVNVYFEKQSMEYRQLVKK